MMKSYIKTGILALLLAIPVFFIIFLNKFGKNYHTLPVFYATDSVKTDKGYTITGAHTIPEFTFFSQSGDSFSSKELTGKIYVADFFFTRCPSICPEMSTQLTRVQEEFMGDDEVKIVSFTVDPVYDTVGVLNKYAGEYRAKEGKWFFLTGSKDSIYQLAQQGFFISAMEDKERPLDFIHSEKFVLVDKTGRIRGYYNGTDPADVDRLVTEIKVLQKIYKDEKQSP